MNYIANIFQINLFLLIKNKSWFCTTHCKLSTTFKHTKNNKQLILIPKDFDIKKIS